MLLAEGPTSLLSTSLYATLPFWPLLGAILVGIMLTLRQKTALAHWPVVLGVGVSAVLGVLLFFDLGRTHTAEHGPPTPAAQAEASPEDMLPQHTAAIAPPTPHTRSTTG